MRQSSVLLHLIEKQDELYLDEFVDCFDGLLDCVDLMYGANVEITMENIQAISKFSLFYKIEGLFDKCLSWLKSSHRMSLDSFLTFFRLGMFLKSIDVEQDEILNCCKKIILESQIEDVLRVCKNWCDEENVLSFLCDQELLPFSFSVITQLIDSEKKVLMALDKMEDLEWSNIEKANSEVLEMVLKMNELWATLPSLKRVNHLQIILGYTGVITQVATREISEPTSKRLCLDSL